MTNEELLSAKQALVANLESSNAVELKDNVIVKQSGLLNVDLLDRPLEVKEFTRDGSKWHNVLLTVLNRTFSIKLHGSNTIGTPYIELCDITYNGTTYTDKLRICFK